MHDPMVALVERLNSVPVSTSEMKGLLEEAASLRSGGRAPIGAGIHLIRARYHGVRALALYYRIRALAVALAEGPLGGWELDSLDDLELLGSQQVLDAAAGEPLRAVEGDIGFDVESFIRKALGGSAPVRREELH